MKRGINTEIHAKEKYKQRVKKSHKNVKVKRARNDNTTAIYFLYRLALT